jgi:hypothetical protein
MIEKRKVGITQKKLIRFLITFSAASAICLTLIFILMLPIMFMLGKSLGEAIAYYVHSLFTIPDGQRFLAASLITGAFIGMESILRGSGALSYFFILGIRIAFWLGAPAIWLLLPPWLRSGWNFTLISFPIMFGIANTFLRYLYMNLDEIQKEDEDAYWDMKYREKQRKKH